MALKVIDKELLEGTARRALSSERLRMNHNLHELSDPVQRMLNAIEPLSYIRPHRHSTPPKVELFLILKGRGAVVLFNDSGEVAECRITDPAGPIVAVEVEPGAWHTVLSFERGTVFFEVKDGPYEPKTDKDFAQWSPGPEEAGANEYLEELKLKAIAKAIP